MSDKHTETGRMRLEGIGVEEVTPVYACSEVI